MSNFIWFILGALLYKILSSFIIFNQKAEFIKNIKITALLLIGKAYEQLLFATSLKYKILFKTTNNEEEIKLLQNEDEVFLNNWKKETISILNSSVSPLYKDTLQVHEWDDLMILLDTYYKKGTKERIKTNEREDK